MNEILQLFIVLVVLYSWESSVWLHPSGVVLGPRRFNRQFSQSRPLRLSPHFEKNLFLHSLLPPLSPLVIFFTHPITLNAKDLLNKPFHLLGSQWPRHPLVAWAWGEIQNITADGSRLYINGQKFVDVSSSRLAQSLKEIVQKCLHLQESERQTLIADWERKAFDTTQVAEIKGELDKKTRWLRMMCNLLWLEIFVVFPLVVVSWGIAMTWVYIVATIWGTLLVVCILFWQAAKTLEIFEASERWAKIFTMIFMPVAGIRAADLLWREGFVCFHPLAAGNCFLDRKDLLKMARKVLGDLNFPMDGQKKLRKINDRMWYMEAAQQCVHTSQIKETEMIAKWGPEVSAMCPRCQKEYSVRDLVHCLDCAGVSLSRA